MEKEGKGVEEKECEGENRLVEVVENPCAVPSRLMFKKKLIDSLLFLFFLCSSNLICLMR